MTLHSAKGLEFDTVFLPGWEEGLFPSQRTLDESGRAGLEEERRLAHVGLTRARKRAKIYFATNRRIHGLWTTTVPSRFLDELPEAHVEVKEAQGGAGGFGMGGYGAVALRRHDDFGSNYSTPGWQRAQERKARGERASFDETGAPKPRRGFQRAGQLTYVPDPDAGTYDSSDRTIYEDDAVALPLAARSARKPRRGPRQAPHAAHHRGRAGRQIDRHRLAFTVGDRVFHQKFGNGNVVLVDGNKLTIAFDKAGEKRVVDSFVERV